MRKWIYLFLIAALVAPFSFQPRLLVAQDQGTVVADGLNGPMGLLMDENGTLWVIEAGTGGDTDLPFTDTQTGQPITAKYGETAQVITIASDGTKKVVTTLPSVATGADILGGARLAVLNGKVYATIGQWLGDPSAEAGLPNMGVVAEIKEGSATAVASTWDFERTQNPDGLLTDSHPFGLTANQEEGVLWIVDAGGNALLRTNPMSGRVRLVAVFDGIPAPFENPGRNNEKLTDPVPTAVVARDGVIYVSLLSGFPFAAGSAKVVTVGADGTVSDYATSLTMLTDLRLGPDNELYAVQFAETDESGPMPDSGALIRIAEGTGSNVVIGGLSFPTSVTFSPEGDAYIAINGVGAPGSGQVVKYVGATATAAAVAAAAAEAVATETMTETATITDTVTDTITMTDTMVMTETMVMSDTAAMTHTMAMTDTTAVTYTATTTETSASMATETVVPAVTASDQESNGASVGVDQVVAAEQGWIVIHADAEGKPGPVLGQASVPPGTTDNIVVTLDTPLTESSNLWAMLHIDGGTMGTYEFPGTDGPVIIDNAVVMQPFTANVAAAAAEPVAKEGDAAGATRESDQAREPETIPATGAGLNDVSATTMPVVALILLLLAVGAFATRRREA